MSEYHNIQIDEIAQQDLIVSSGHSLSEVAILETNN